ncbi:restriction endonuclease subunit S [Corynebacterium sp. NPDC060344]|uniref:restriction endonuclease subunit S n=1 Tax=Corynebacterium sp. NPDC060344 TaxID=3347101 RepID=UPI00364BA7D5
MKTAKLGYLVRFRNGQDAKSVESPDGEYPIIGSGGEFSRANSFLHDGESLLFGRKGTIDRPLHVNGKFWTVDTMYFTEIGPEVSGRYLYYWATTIPFDKISTQTALPSMTSFKLSQLEVPLPDLRTQRRLADYLDRETAQIDAMAGALDGLVARLEERRHATLVDSITRSGELLGGVATRSDYWPPIQKEWHVVRLGNLGSVQSGIALGSKKYSEGKEYPYLRVANVQDGSLDLSNVKTLRIPESVAIKYKVPENSVLMTEGGDRDKLGRGTIWRNEISDCLHQNHIFAFRCGNRITPEYLSFVLESQPARMYFDLTASQSTNLATTSSFKVKSFPLPLPPLDEQRRIVDHLDAETVKIDAMIAKAGELRSLLDERRSALITAVVTGQHPVPKEP